MSGINYDLTKIKAFLFDVDGVLSSASIPLYPTGEPMRVINTKDGYAMQLAAKKGYILGIITGADSQAVRIRFENLGFRYIYMESRNKKRDFEHFIQRTDLDMEEVCYVGDDIPDYDVMKMVGLSACPIDSAPEIKEIACYISPLQGGTGVGRDIIEQVLKAQGNWMQEDAFGW